jgi:glucose-1-phosphate thymidylyltransferase
MKALILCGGSGTRLMPLTRTTPKQLLSVANKPILFYLLEQVREIGIGEIGIVVSPGTGSRIKEAVGDGSRWGACITYIDQPEPLGLAHAVMMAQGFLGDACFLMLLGDNLIDCAVGELVDRFNSDKADALITLKEVTDPRQFGVAEVNDKGEVICLVEKPKEIKSRLAIAGGYIFTPEIHQAIAGIKPSFRGELEITDALQKLIEMGKKVTSYALQGWWFDIGTREGLLKANSTVLDTCLKTDIKGSLDAKSQALGRVAVQQGTRVVGSTIRGPVSIGEGCRIKSSLIGPFVSIGDGVVVEGSTIEYSIILEGCRIYKTRLICNSVVGRNTKVTTKGSTSGVIELFAGDDDRLEL